MPMARTYDYRVKLTKSHDVGLTWHFTRPNHGIPWQSCPSGILLTGLQSYNADNTK